MQQSPCDTISFLTMQGNFSGRILFVDLLQKETRHIRDTYVDTTNKGRYSRYCTSDDNSEEHMYAIIAKDVPLLISDLSTKKTCVLIRNNNHSYKAITLIAAILIEHAKINNVHVDSPQQVLQHIKACCFTFNINDFFTSPFYEMSVNILQKIIGDNSYYTTPKIYANMPPLKQDCLTV